MTHRQLRLNSLTIDIQLTYMYCAPAWSGTCSAADRAPYH